jgi:hypothetical protein
MGLDPSDRLHELYRLTERNLELRRRFLGLGSAEVAALRKVARWADGAAADDLVARDRERPRDRQRRVECPDDAVLEDHAAAP